MVYCHSVFLSNIFSSPARWIPIQNGNFHVNTVQGVLTFLLDWEILDLSVKSPSLYVGPSHWLPNGWWCRRGARGPSQLLAEAGFAVYHFHQAMFFFFFFVFEEDGIELNYRRQKGTRIVTCTHTSIEIWTKLSGLKACQSACVC